MAYATPSLRSPRSVRVGDHGPKIVRADSVDELAATVAAEVAGARRRAAEREPRRGRPRPAHRRSLRPRSAGAGINHGTATRTGLDAGVTLVPVSVVKGLELDGVVVVEPTQIVSDVEQGMRSLYVALTRSTQRLTVVHALDLPEPLR